MITSLPCAVLARVNIPNASIISTVGLNNSANNIGSLPFVLTPLEIGVNSGLILLVEVRVFAALLRDGEDGATSGVNSLTFADDDCWRASAVCVDADGRRSACCDCVGIVYFLIRQHYFVWLGCVDAGTFGAISTASTVTLFVTICISG